MATQVASIGVGKLSSTAKYVDTFIVELYSDSGYTIKIGQQTSTAQWNGSAWVQKDSIIFGGLVFGTTYYLRAAVIAPISGALSSWSTFNTAAGSASAPGSTYSGTFVATTSGIGYIVTPASVPSDIDHFEAVWVWDSSTPASTTISYWSGQITNGTFNFFVGGTPGSTAKVYVRAVNTSQQAQGWQLIDTRAVSTTWSGVTTGTIGDSTLLGTGGPAVNSGSTGRLGIGGTQDASNFLTAYGTYISTKNAGNSGYWSYDTSASPATFVTITNRASGGYFIQDNGAALNRTQINMSGAYAVGGAPASDNIFTALGSTSGAPGRFGVTGTDSFLRMTATTAGRGYGLYNISSTFNQYDETASALRTSLTTSGGYGIGTNGPGSDFYFTNSGRSYFQNTGPGVGLSDSQVGGRLYLMLSGSGLASGYTIFNGTNSNYPLMINNSAQTGLGAVTPGSYMLRTTGEIFSGAGTNPAFSFADRTSGAVTTLYGSSGFPRLFSGSSDFATFNPSTGAMGLGGTYTGDWISIQGTPVIASDKNLYNQIGVSGKPRNLADVTDMSNGQMGQNLMENASWDLAANPGTGDIVAGWHTDGTGGFSISVETTSGFVYSGSNAIYMSAAINQSIPAGSTLAATVKPNRAITTGVKQGQKYWVRAKVRTDAAVAMTAGLLKSTRLRMLVTYSDASTQIPISNEVTVALGAYTDIFGLLTVPDPPAGKTVTSLLFYPEATIFNSTGGTLSTPSSLAWDVRFDNFEVIRIADTSTDEVAKVGSTPPTLRGTMSYTSTTSSITWSWNLNIYRSDTAMTVLNVNSSQAVTGLLASTSYNFYPFYDEGTLSGTTGINMVATGGSGSPSWAHSGTNFSWTQEQSRSDHVPLAATPIVGSTTSSGSGGGSGGGDPSCLALNTLVKERSKGVITLEQLQVGDYLWSEGDTWLQVERKKVSPHDLWIDVEFGCNQIIESTAGHNWKLRDGEIKASHSLSLIDEIPCSTGVTHPSSLKLRKETQDAVAITLEAPHTFYACSDEDAPWVLTHNMQVSPC